LVSRTTAKIRAADELQAVCGGGPRSSIPPYFRGAIVDHTNFNGTDVASARIDAAQKKAFSGAKNLDRAFTE
jgi:hypothetical protein